ncbi:hypothetical protein MKZ17_17305 [Solibacillus sp. FSL R7-0682]|uniref:hypothetical protein n=1 Tax=Solibacillus sp. FSL R7-0682 TaxID=2921690 RepID=UPI0030FBC61C
MGIQLGDFFKDTFNVFTLEEAEQIYKSAGYVDISELFPGFREITFKMSDQELYNGEHGLFSQTINDYKLNQRMDTSTYAKLGGMIRVNESLLKGVA